MYFGCFSWTDRFECVAEREQVAAIGLREQCHLAGGGIDKLTIWWVDIRVSSREMSGKRTFRNLSFFLKLKIQIAHVINLHHYLQEIRN